MLSRAVVVAALLLLSACGDAIVAGGDINGGVIPVASAGTFAFIALTVLLAVTGVLH